jgi:mannose/cellobiose epimerase-like protein (N-acyl-D-glucosamine 2-epimerase family)
MQYRMTVELITSCRAPLTEAASDGVTWLLEAAAPVWSTVGRTRSGLFAERMTLAGDPDSAYFRTFVQARHIFSFVVIGQLGWAGPWRQLVSETMEAVISGAKRDDGLYVHRLDVDGRPLDRRADLYDQAFILLALGTAAGALGRKDWIDQAEELLDRTEAAWRHPLGGFREGEIADDRVRRQNPHMHLLEAFLTLHHVSGRARFLQAAHAIAELAQERFIEPESGALLEYFTDELEAAAGLDGRIAEPGHCFEWAWLFERLVETGWSGGVLLSDRLTNFARKHGIDAGRGVAINEVLADGTIHDAAARLWPQTERLKAAVARHRRLQTGDEAGEVLAANCGLRQYLDAVLPGLWRDKLRQDGSWVEEMAPGSSLYHISCAYAELAKLLH